MSCINVNIQMLNWPLAVSAERISGDINTNVTLKIEPIRGNIFDAEIHPIEINIFDTIVHPKVRTSIVCSIKYLKNYLNVSPEEVQWITPEYGVIYNVSSDLDWIVVVDNDDNSYLNVSPEEEVWVTDDSVITYNVESNTDWVVVTP